MNTKKILSGLEITFGALLALGGIGMFVIPDQIVAFLCPNKPLFGLFMILAGVLLAGKMYVKD